VCQQQAQNCCIFSANGTLLLRWHCDRLPVDLPLSCFVALLSPSQHLPSCPALRANGIRQPVRPTQPRLSQGTSLSELLLYFDVLSGGSFACMAPIKFHDAPLHLASEGCRLSLALPQLVASNDDQMVSGFYLSCTSLTTNKALRPQHDYYDVCRGACLPSVVDVYGGSCTCFALSQTEFCLVTWIQRCRSNLTSVGHFPALLLQPFSSRARSSYTRARSALDRFLSPFLSVSLQGSLLPWKCCRNCSRFGVKNDG
jgi:hypothetical protein